MDDSGRRAVLIVWLECESCGRIDLESADFNYLVQGLPADEHRWARIICECGRQAKLNIKREIKAAN